ncbi:hypothetical protein L596_029793 [Steinernema carpocapsae]|uniref:Uncharacterized protein n=1 Tax=Steinernema carpocapsae TaxID=34508 RepID=A0A4V5ZXC7_STECR|nr:hypothetical protein L596_029793 [Steinernema carpocapsae]
MKCFLCYMLYNLEDFKQDLLANPQMNSLRCSHFFTICALGISQVGNNHLVRLLHFVKQHVSRTFFGKAKEQNPEAHEELSSFSVVGLVICIKAAFACRRGFPTTADLKPRHVNLLNKIWANQYFHAQRFWM